MRISPLIGLAGVALLLGVAGCALSRPPAPTATSTPPPPAAAPSSSPFPLRPAELRLDGVNPCALLTPTQLNQLGIYVVTGAGIPNQPGTASCDWATNKTGSSDQWLATVMVNRGADYALSNGVPVQIVQIGGFGAVQTYSPGDDPNTGCIQVVDVAHDQSLLVGYDNFGRGEPATNHEFACQQDSKVAELLIQNLRTRTAGS